MTPAHRREFFKRLSEALPEPKTELVYANAFELLIAVILSAQATDVSVNRATQTLFQAAPTPEAMLALGEAGLIAHIRRIGLYKNKARHILHTCAKLVTEHASAVPNTREALEALPGVGRKTANVVLNSAFGQPVIAVDTHIFRVANRTGLAPGATVREVEDKLMRAVPKAYLQGAHHWLLLHGRYVCTARAPRCSSCLVNDLCAWPEKRAFAASQG